MPPLTFLPQPQSITYHDGEVTLPDRKLIAIPDPSVLFIAERVQKVLKERFHLSWEIVVDQGAIPPDQLGLSFQPGLTPGTNPNSYRLDIESNLISITGPSDQSYWYGACTLLQIFDQAVDHGLPLLSINDWPDFERRGVMLDISRDKVPTLETLYALVDLLASWKINEFQLYTEHSFAYRQHKVVWANATPITGEEIMKLDRYCRERYIDLVPNQNSFGHMHRWLMHDEYRELAEVPEGLDWPMFHGKPRPFSISPAEPRALELIESMFDELLPHFTSNYFNVGCDETSDLGKGRSRDAVEAQGRGRVYVDYLKKIANLVRSHKRTMQFWGDIIMEHPEMVHELPKDIIALEWGYEADHPFDLDGQRFAEAGIRFYVCPGTSSWLSLMGRTDNAMGNLLNAAVNGRKHDAMGYLNTDWGDYGHMQPLSTSYLGYAYGAALSWAVDANTNLDLAAVLNQFAFNDPTGTMGKVAYELGNVYLTLDDARQYNGAAPVRALLTPIEKMASKPWLPKVTDPVRYAPEKIRRAMAKVEELTAEMDSAQPSHLIAIWEYKLATGLWLHGCKRLLLAAGDEDVSPTEMAVELRGLMEGFREVWLLRNRPGGLEDSLSRLQRLLAEYEQLEKA
jgi:hexosaminidase